MNITTYIANTERFIVFLNPSVWHHSLQRIAIVIRYLGLTHQHTMTTIQ